ncbi:MAG: class I SAM-dependent methyltransferase [Xanthomonadales bacterium]|nr:class I SAM-dependent methyltransferase [Gammaproteobacteria bacterium]NND58155.1 class I SAM-dependent methyltransferase [Xanthomonadales bacterium]NNK52524.1 class I SAM-dependent methyltransferase [Xanthomonadales bacterium]
MNLDESVAQAMEADVRLLPLLPELLTDLWELGPSADQVAAILESAGVEPESTVLDLACGKGAVAVALAEQLGVQVKGIDAFQPFLQAARALAAERGVSHRCRFEQGDIRNLLVQEEQYDVALLLSVGPVLGNYEQTIAGLRRLVRAGGYIVIEDGFLADGVALLSSVEGYAGHSETLRQLTACGDVVAQEVICPMEQTHSVNQRNMDLIRQRASLVRASNPAFQQLIDEYVARQERETQILNTDVHCAIWVLRRA